MEKTTTFIQQNFYGRVAHMKKLHNTQVVVDVGIHHWQSYLVCTETSEGRTESQDSGFDRLRSRATSLGGSGVYLRLYTGKTSKHY